LPDPHRAVPARNDHHVVIIGSGIGGLSAALELACAGLKVTVLERADSIGGKLHQRYVNGIGIDSGPTVFTMRWVFDGLFQKAGSRLETMLDIHRQEILARHAWSQNERLDLYADHQHSAIEIESFAGKAQADLFLKFCEQARTTYRAMEKAYIRSERPSFVSMNAELGVSGMKVLWDVGLFKSLWQSLSRYFPDKRLHQLFSRYATYCGSSPLQAPATLMLIADVEMQGVWVIHGGMTALAKAIASLATQHGATIRTNADVSEILMRHGNASGVRLADGETIESHSVIFNGDVAALKNGLVRIEGQTDAFGPHEDDLEKRSLSAITLSMHAPTSGFPLVHHNLFFHDDYASEFQDIFSRRKLPEKPTVYLCAQDRRDHAPVAAEAERLLLLINAPATGDRQTFNAPEIDACLEAGFSLMQRCGLSIGQTEANTVVSTPASFHRRFPATGGALYGHATHGWMSSFARHSSNSPISGLYLAGGSVHPGPGVPMAALSGRLAAATLMGRLGLIKPSGRVVISGGTSTH